MAAALVYVKNNIRRVNNGFQESNSGIFAAVMAMTSVCFADPETPVTTDVPATDPVPETTTTAQPQREDTETTTTTTAQTWETTTWGTTTSYSYVPDTPTSTPTVVKLVVSEVKDKKVHSENKYPVRPPYLKCLYLRGL